MSEMSGLFEFCCLLYDVTTVSYVPNQSTIILGLLLAITQQTIKINATTCAYNEMSCAKEKESPTGRHLKIRAF